ncbi:hypothetical protein L249_6308 [Ophiocordyceps polyrhachis-furcata BCC 54312]|uniref:Ubiquitin-related modifier 1 n=1 Tax=Ophiocordyceps polyrhachis-furcata BCC 54312 TaxID=1330021 RepID=A0A367L1B1_9HYPO|nr:hypothetical protein L249_6308 [Ophiocordyceps polyrhachis-furcata BCC 54312]
MLFADQRHHSLTLPAKDSQGGRPTMAYLIGHLCEHVIQDTRKHLFVLDGHMLRILVLINDADWELEDEEKYELKAGDNILFVSTLHGG